MMIIDPNALETLRQSKSIELFDIRDREAYSRSHIDGAKHLDLNQFETICQDLEKTTPIVICCYHGISSQKVAEKFILTGFTEVYSLKGGYTEWSDTRAADVR